jgi:ParB/RepB/Spo0J family partition protein
MRLREHDAVKSKFDAFRVDPRQLKVTEGYNVRDFTTPQAKESLEILKESIREEGGVIVPLEVRMIGEEVHIVSGHRRHRAVMELIAEGVEIESIPAVTEAKAVNDAERVLRLVTHNAGEPLTMLEKAEVVRRLINMGWSREKIAARLGYKTPQTIANFELLLAAPERVRQAIRQEEISPSTAIELVREHGDAASGKLYDIKKAAAERGKTRASIRDIRQPAGNAHPAAIERRETQRLAAHMEQSQRDLEAAESAIEMLFDLGRRGVKAKTVAEAFGGRDTRAADVALRWLDEFRDALKQRDVA